MKRFCIGSISNGRGESHYNACKVLTGTCSVTHLIKGVFHSRQAFVSARRMFQNGMHDCKTADIAAMRTHLQDQPVVRQAWEAEHGTGACVERNTCFRFQERKCTPRKLIRTARNVDNRDQVTRWDCTQRRWQPVSRLFSCTHDQHSSRSLHETVSHRLSLESSADRQQHTHGPDGGTQVIALQHGVCQRDAELLVLRLEAGHLCVTCVEMYRQA